MVGFAEAIAVGGVNWGVYNVHTLGVRIGPYWFGLWWIRYLFWASQCL